MKKAALALIVIMSFVLVSCGQDSTESKSKKADKKYEEVTVEKYVNFYKEADALMMEKYWPKLKGKAYDEGKDLYEQYKKEEKALLEKHSIEDFSDLQSFFRRNFKEVNEYRKNDSDYKEYPEMDEARKQFIDYAMKQGAGK
jgi:hypothetical protein